MKKIAFVCVDFNGIEYTRELCESLERQSGCDVEFSLYCLVVDNSTDADASKNLQKMLASNEISFYYSAGGNLGYFGGLNAGLKKLSLDDWDYIVICNNDLVFDELFCRNLVSSEYPNNVYAICPDVVTSDNYHQNPHVLKKINWLRRLKYDLYFSNFYIAQSLLSILKFFRPVKNPTVQYKNACEIHMGIGACYVLTKSFLKVFENLHYPHFLYGEEAFFSNQIHRALLHKASPLGW